MRNGAGEARERTYMSGSTTDTRRWARPTEDRLDGPQKSLPEAADGRTVAEFLAGRPRLSEFSTPLLVLDDGALADNTARMAGWCAEHGVELAPHGKTTMAPDLWRRQLDAGAWGITVATGTQLWVAVAAGVSRVQLANALVDPAALARLAGLLDADPELDVLSWADSVDTVAAMEAALAAVAPTRPDPARPLTVLVELGAPGGRTGARDLATARAVADAVTAAPHLQLAGVAG
jgi:D-serine deaminase-like pyridoxal phosphate-dependent protein